MSRWRKRCAVWRESRQPWRSDFNQHVQEAAGRVQPYETVVHAVRLLRDAGIAALKL